MATGPRNPFQKKVCAWSFILTECVQALEKCLRNTTNTCQCPFGCGLQPCSKGKKKCSCSPYTSNPQENAPFSSGIKLRLQEQLTGLALREQGIWAAPRRSAGLKPMTPVTVGSAVFLIFLGHWNSLPDTVKRSLSKFPATSVQANEFTSSTLSGHPESSHTHD